MSDMILLRLLTLIKSSGAVISVSLLRATNVSGTISVPTIKVMITLAYFNEMRRQIAREDFIKAY
jgi:hypothetical protein